MGQKPDGVVDEKRSYMHAVSIDVKGEIQRIESDLVF
jgi:hypothetical protein